IGTVMTVLVILGGDNKEGVLEVSWVDWSSLWKVFLGMLGAGWLASLVGLVKLDRARQIERAALAVVVVGLGALLAVLLYQGEAARLSDSAMRILWQLMKGSMAALVLLAGCAMVFKKRAGVVLLHAGVGLMMINELVVYSLHVESQMQIEEGQTVNYTQDTRHLELAIVDPSPADYDDVTVVPIDDTPNGGESWSDHLGHALRSLGRTIAGRPEPQALKAGEQTDDARLPCDVQLLQFFPNSDLRELKKGEKPQATVGEGVNFAVVERRPGSGTDMGGEIDLASAYVKLIPRDKSAEPQTLLLSQLFTLRNLPQSVDLGGKQYNVFLRFERINKPYAIRLNDVSQTTYLGTSTPRDYSSILHIIDQQLGIDRDNVRVWMNNPLRFAGDTFYQSGYHRDPVTGKEGTTLQVVSNTGWMIPYVAVTIVSVGMLAHFLLTLSRFLARRREAVEGVRVAPAARKRGAATAGIEPVSWTARLLPWAVVALFAGMMLSRVRMPVAPAGTMDLNAFGALPLAYEGRVKPFDTLARTSLRAISGRETFSDPPANEKHD
ncbi:MAG TPA: cytochrome c biogenesis protein ResB, partial [Pirellulales bacterium]|nr:cytochrome c biogenesis protein ResB [Pirellulales bacterium]